MSNVTYLRAPFRPTPQQREERAANSGFYKGYWAGLRDASLIDGMVLALAFLFGFGLALITIGAA